MRVALLAAVFLVTACASDRPPRKPQECELREEVIDAYLDRVANLAIDKMSTIALAEFDQVTIALEIAESGAVSHLSVMSASHPLAAEAAREAVRSAAPFPPPPKGLDACLLAGRAVIGIYSSGRCDEPKAEVYLEAVSAAIRTAIESQGIAVKYDGDVILRLELARDGTVEFVRVQRADMKEAGVAVAAATRALKRFDPPEELIQDCVAGDPILLWIPLSEI